jgi:excisionase family DNA binding protein
MADNSHNLTSDKLAYGVADAARVAGFGRSTLYEALASGSLRAVKLGRRTLIPVDELRRFLGTLPPARSAHVRPSPSRRSRDRS